MVSLFWYFCNNLNISVSEYEFHDLFPNFMNEIVVDNSEFVVVDGEEGDYGVTKYYTKSGSLFAVETNNGGDDVDVEFTETGRDILGVKLKMIITNKIKNMDIYESDE